MTDSKTPKKKKNNWFVLSLSISMKLFLYIKYIAALK